MSPFDYLRALAHIKALQDKWTAVMAEPSVKDLIATGIAVANELGLTDKAKEMFASMNEPPPPPKK